VYLAQATEALAEQEVENEQPPTVSEDVTGDVYLKSLQTLAAPGENPEDFFI